MARAYRIATPLHEFMRSMTHREYQTRLAYERNLWNRPDRSDYYLMQIAAEIKKVLHKRPERVKTGHFKIPFEFGDQPKLGPTKEEAAAWAKAKWFGMVGTVGQAGKKFLNYLRGP